MFPILTNFNKQTQDFSVWQYPLAGVAIVYSLESDTCRVGILQIEQNTNKK